MSVSLTSLSFCIIIASHGEEHKSLSERALHALTQHIDDKATEEKSRPPLGGDLSAPVPPSSVLSAAQELEETLDSLDLPHRSSYEMFIYFLNTKKHILSQMMMNNNHLLKIPNARRHPRAERISCEYELLKP
jgi:hypothetical protein